MINEDFFDPLLFRQYIKIQFSDLVTNAYLHKEKIDKLLNQELSGSLNSLAQLFLQYVLKEWACPNCLQTILPFMNNCYEVLPENGDISYVSSPVLLAHFPVLACPHCDTQIVVIATSEHSDIFEFRYKYINGIIYDLHEERALDDIESNKLGLTKKGRPSLFINKLKELDKKKV
ncbi:MAG: hypothetical protein ACW964_05540 [Candidatus Hodarchaeales archaeon]